MKGVQSVGNELAVEKDCNKGAFRPQQVPTFLFGIVAQHSKKP